MGHTIDQIEDQIEARRDDLRGNFEELGDKVKSAVDWRQRFRSNPGAILAVAFGSGFLLAAALGAARSSRAGMPRDTMPAQGVTEYKRGRLMQVWGEIQSALLGVVAAKVTDTLSGVVPGFKEHLSTATDSTHGRAGGSRAH